MTFKYSPFILFFATLGLAACTHEGSSPGDDAAAGAGAPVATEEQATRVAILLAEGFHDGEAYMTHGFLSNHGCEVDVIGIEKGKVTAYNSNFTIDVQKRVSDVSVADYDALVLPGGKGPAVLREHDEVLDFVRSFWQTEKPIAAICHGPQVLISAGLLDGVRATGVSGIKDELLEAGAKYEDSPLVTDRQLITSRVPDDLPKFASHIARTIEKREERGL